MRIATSVVTIGLVCAAISAGLNPALSPLLFRFGNLEYFGLERSLETIDPGVGASVFCLLWGEPGRGVDLGDGPAGGWSDRPGVDWSDGPGVDWSDGPGMAAAVLRAAGSRESQSQTTVEPHRRIATRAARLISGKGDAVLNNAVIEIEEGKIAAIGSGLAIPPNAEVIDLGDETLLPGLIDAHTHLLMEMDGAKVLEQDSEMLRIVATESTAQRALRGAGRSCA